MNDTENRITELEIRVAFQDELLANLNDTIVQMRETLDLQQAQLRLLYHKLQNQADTASNNKPYSLIEEVPPHY
ncbi:MAG: SlyX family protein [Alysiella sp.]|uniref:SlyX family protein n=1 Tax=Alysiella sp. TaxID=1872483 RepID=UPI0026DCA680|nr:SlyX family protein [Alysiella sp.]MDO4433236.1 SlyX family protein [Alysiella sp.]